MNSKILEKLDYLDDTADETLLEFKVWRTTMFAITEAQRIYSEQMLEAGKIMRSYLEEEGQSEKSRGSSVHVMKQLLNVVTLVASLHTKVWAEFCDVRGPYNRLMEWEDRRYEQLKAKSATYWNQHQNLVEATMAERKSYLTCLERWTEMKDRLSGMMSKKDIAQDSRFSALTGKVDVALTKYQAHFRREAKHRHRLAEQTEDIKQRFIHQEKDKLDCLFVTIDDLLKRIKKIIPIGAEEAGNVTFSFGNSSTEDLAEQSLVSHLNSFMFQKYQGPSGTDPTGPAQPILKEGDFKRKKPGPVSIFSVVARDNYFPQKKSDKKSKTDGEPSSKRPVRRQSSTTSPDPDGQEEDTSDAREAEGPNLGPLDIDDDLSLDDGLMFEKDKSAQKNLLSPTPPMDDYHAIETSNSFSEDTTGSYGTNDAVQKYVDIGSESEEIQEMNCHNAVARIQPKKDERHGILKSENMPTSSRMSKTFENLSENKGQPSSDVSNRISPAVKRKLSKTFDKERCKPKDAHRERKDEVLFESSTSQDTSSSSPYQAKIDKPLKQLKTKPVEKDKPNTKGSEDGKTKGTIGYKLAKRKRSKQSLRDHKTLTTKETAMDVPGPTVDHGKEVSVLVVKDRVKVEADEISIRAGMKIKQTRKANENGMAYGYKKTKLGIRKYGYYPAHLVTLYNTRARSSDNLN